MPSFILSRKCWLLMLLLLTGVQAAVAQDGKTKANPAAEKAQAASSTCLSCHSDVGDKIKSHAHASVACQTCHVKHDDYPHPNVPKPVCASCHTSVAKDYAHGVHGQAVSKGNAAAPDCGTCHGKAHELDSTKTAQFRSGIPDICGSCHADIGEEYKQSVHGQAVARGVVRAPVCIDCHGEHSILPPSNSASTVHSSHIRDTCARCHGDVQLSRQFGLPGDRVVSFDASFHGLANKSGTQTVANCASCHGFHNIRASSDPKSTINATNLPATCGKCHVGAGERFALGHVHLSVGGNEPVPVKWVRWIYLLVIPLTIGLMLVHNLGDWLHKLLRLRFNGRMENFTPPAHTEIRMLPPERIQHVLLAVSFIVLAWTGFALKYPDHWWARPLLIWESSHAMRGIVHRAASVVFMAAALAHLLSLIMSRSLRDHWRVMWPRVRDAREAVENFLYNVGLSRKAPYRSPYSYIEKAEYWALVWGTIVMVGTGLLLWADNLTLRWLPKIVLDLATSIHFYEAILATLAIVVWHFYSVIFDPEVYPMDPAWLTGKSPRNEPAEEHS